MIAVILIIAILIALVFLVLNIQKMNEVHKKTKGVIKSRQDLLIVKEYINFSMKGAIFYIIFTVLFFAYVVILFIMAKPFQALCSLFLFGVITLPMGLIGKYIEKKKIRKMDIQSDDPEIAEKWQRYLTQWDKPGFRLSE